MTQITEAVYANGVLKPSGKLNLDEQQHVRITVEPIEAEPIEAEPIEASVDRQSALARLRNGIAAMQFSSDGPLPGREELHERP